MFKKRYFSARSDFKTGIFCKLAFILGMSLLIISLFFIAGSFLIGEGSAGILQQIYDFSKTTHPTSILAFSIIIIAVGFILYFFHCQLAKLAKIADEIENEEDLEEPTEK
jgi:hypothetical protein